MENTIEEKRDQLVIYWLLRAIFSSKGADCYEFFEFAAETEMNDDKVDIFYIYQTCENADRIKGI